MNLYSISLFLRIYFFIILKSSYQFIYKYKPKYMQKVPQDVLHNYIRNENLRKHCRAVAACMEFYATGLGEDSGRWYAAGLLHDIDYELYPDTHPNTAIPILKKAGYDNDFIDVILSHAYPDRTDVPRNSLISKYLFACDEITGIVMAYALMKPQGIFDVEVKGVKKKMKDKAFARTVNREDIIKGAAEISLPLDIHIANVIEAMKTLSDNI